MGRAALRVAWVAAAALAGCGSEDELPYPEGPDVVLVSIDSLRFDHLGCYGYSRPTSPTLDALAAEGVRFENTVSTTSWTLPSHAAMFTGLYDSAHGLVDNGLSLGEGHVTLAELMASEGYRTAGFFGGPYLHPAFGLDQGFETYVNCMTTVPTNLSDNQVRIESRAPLGRSHRDVTGPRTRDAVREWAASVDDRPFFLFIHLWDVHYDYIPPREYIERFDPDYEGALTGENFMENPAVHPGMPERDRRHLLALYDAEIRFTDDILGEILASERLRDALVIVTADHGEEFFEHGHKGHQRTLFDEVVRVPLIVRWPDHLAGGRVVQDQVRLIDILPTIAELAGVPGSDRVPRQGRSLVPLLEGETLPPESALCELLVDGRWRGGGELRALRGASWKVLHDKSIPARPTFTGFDLASDPGEVRPLDLEDPGLALHRDDLEDAVERTLSIRKSLARAVEAAEADPQVLEALKQLGYTGDDTDPDEE